MESKQINIAKLNLKRVPIRQEVINFKRRKINEDGDDFHPLQLDSNIILLDTETALEAEPLTIEIDDDDQQDEIEYQGASDFADLVHTEIDEEYDFQNAEIVAEEIGEGQHPLDDLEELEEGEIKVGDDRFGLHYRSIIKEYQCQFCDRAFSQKGNLMRHHQTHTGAKPFICNLCGHKFTQKSNLQKHIATHNGDKKFECGVCHKGFVQKANLIRHLRIHTGEKPFQCGICGHRFTQKGNLNKHMQLHSSEAEYACDYCEIQFASYSAKVRHESSVHGDQSNDNDKTDINDEPINLNCDECPAVFRTHRALIKHKKFHL
ncbi:hypothetical protein WA026_018955 [Henosepilachna vigintioctopunctata]|uniref:C2H2-type domain-containing protein n=1 Tax=Henosepilachna vigintioctopunctata TaxID=420089 RepID=A0AAW1UHH8_9CUCU